MSPNGEDKGLGIQHRLTNALPFGLWGDQTNGIRNERQKKLGGMWVGKNK